MKADLHFHPSFFSRGIKPPITERKIPSLAEIERKALNSKLDLLTITSYSRVEHIDKRWDAYMQELKTASEQFPNEFVSPQTNKLPQAIRFTAKTLQGDYPIYIIHGQEIQTNKGDVNVLFAEKRVPVENSKGDFYWIVDVAKDSGENVLIGLNQLSNFHLPLMKIKELYEHGKIDFVESWNSMDFKKNNQYAQRAEKETQIPGIAVSDGHRLEDMARAFITTDEHYLTTGTYSELARFIKLKLETRAYTNVKGKTNLVGKILYTTKLIHAFLNHKL